MAQKKEVLQIRVKKSLWGKFNLPYAVGHSPELEKKLAEKLIEHGYAITEADAKKLDKTNSGESDNTEE
ncbi:hypothetical protein [Aquimarina sp. 2201CG14-23]|uniref:hypothetical protein n=1 Tax=Aquimarina mycalae TaxID=3040073 RepID=UPI002477ECFD|nr:hypothetical protein [Aquimarina sp. 2201CG14-23]MDH7444672.1 hypothetical protein [Aquimarina sp. 2201CG14-23]